MRASRLLELLVFLQLRGSATAGELAERLEVSVRTVYRDVDALMQAGVPIYTETGRNGGIRLRTGDRATGPLLEGLPFDEAEARAALLAAVPSVADQLGLEPATATSMLLAAMTPRAGSAARGIRDRLLIERADWFRTPDDVPHLGVIATAVWDAREVRVTYRRGDATTSEVVQPLGLVLKGDTWYLLGRTGRDAERLFRVSRVAEATVLDRRFERPVDFDLTAAWERRKQRFFASIPEYPVTVRVAPEAEPLLGLLREGAPDLPLPPDVERDERGWAVVALGFELAESASRLLLQLGERVEVLGPPELRTLMTERARALAALYG